MFHGLRILMLSREIIFLNLNYGQNVRPIVIVLNYGHMYLGKMVRFLLFVLTASLAYIIFEAKLRVAKYGTIQCSLQQGLPMIVLPQWISTNGRMSTVSLRPRHPTLHMSAFRIFRSGQVLIVKDWNKIVRNVEKY